MRSMEVDWTGCPSVEVIPEKVSGVPLVSHSRVPADALVDAEVSGQTPEQIAYSYDLKAAKVREILAYAHKHQLAKPVN